MSSWHRWTATTGNLSRCTEEQLVAVEDVFHAYDAYLKRGEKTIQRSEGGVLADGRGELQLSGDPGETLREFIADIRSAAGFDVGVYISATRDEDDDDYNTYTLDLDDGEPLPDECDDDF